MLQYAVCFDFFFCRGVNLSRLLLFQLPPVRKRVNLRSFRIVYAKNEVSFSKFGLLPNNNRSYMAGNRGRRESFLSWRNSADKSSKFHETIKEWLRLSSLF